MFLVYFIVQWLGFAHKFRRNRECPMSLDMPSGRAPHAMVSQMEKRFEVQEEEALKGDPWESTSVASSIRSWAFLQLLLRRLLATEKIWKDFTTSFTIMLRVVFPRYQIWKTWKRFVNFSHVLSGRGRNRNNNFNWKSFAFSGLARICSLS